MTMSMPRHLLFPGPPARLTCRHIARGGEQLNQPVSREPARIASGRSYPSAGSSVGSRRLKVFAVNPRRFRRAGQDGGGFGGRNRSVWRSFLRCSCVAVRAVRNREAARVAETMRKPAAAV